MDDTTDRGNTDETEGGGTAGDDCTTTGSFADHGIDDGADLIRRTHHRLIAADAGEFEPTDRFLDRLADAFARAYLTVTGTYEVPPHVAAAIDDARVWTGVEFADRPDADLRIEVIPAFYQRAAGFHCAYR